MDTPSSAYAVEVEEPAGNGHVLGLDRNCEARSRTATANFTPCRTRPRLEAQGRGACSAGFRRQPEAVSKRREKDEAAPGEGAAQDREQAPQLASPCESGSLAAKAGTVAVEGLNVKGMTQLREGHHAEAPGTMVAQKAGTEPRDPEHGLDGAQAGCWTARRRT